MSREKQGSEDAEDPEPSGHEEHPGVAEVCLEDGDLGHGDDSGTVGDGLGKQQPKVGLVMDRAEGVIDSRRHDGVDAREGAVQDCHQDAIPSLSSQRFLTFIGRLIIFIRMFLSNH